MLLHKSLISTPPPQKNAQNTPFDKNILLIATGGVFLFLLTMLTVPLADDWSYLASPRIVSEYRLAQFRRFFDILIGLFNQKHPETFPWLNRILIVFSHTVCAVLLDKISREILSVRAQISLIFALLFLIGGNTIVTVINYDCFNQTGSLMFGALGIYLFAKTKSMAKKYIIYFLSCLLALCVKEAGIVYFAIIPLFGLIKSINHGNFDVKTEIKTLALFYVPGFICALLYYFSPIIQSEQLWVYSKEGTSVTDYIVGIVRRLVFSYTQIDQTTIVTYIKGNPLSLSEVIFTGISVFLSVPIFLLLLLMFVNFVKSRNKNAIIVLIIVLMSVIVFTPTLMSSPSGSIWSNNCIVFFANLAYCCLLNEAKGKALYICVAVFALSSVIAFSGIMYQAIQTGIRQEQAIGAIKQKLDPQKDISTYIVFNLNTNRTVLGHSYPLRLYTIQQIFGFGGSMLCIFGYDTNCTSINLTNDIFEYKGNKWEHPIYLELSDDELLEYAQSEAQKSVESGEYDVALVVLYTDEFYLYQN